MSATMEKSERRSRPRWYQPTAEQFNGT